MAGLILCYLALCAVAAYGLALFLFSGRLLLLLIPTVCMSMFIVDAFGITLFNDNEDPEPLTPDS